ncbi:hypothetical protein BEWA_006400 [Theileria equi strain WA]|uniref:Uncharacterized protein n=1 Tax=Theileria equi strain WA TaxID=1537102 RepID=L0B1V8_THEEQ|nr:hypothetical protein BEWA_006400 [Theileria equi strain WA]AFZ81231.1 hypothetical protein BEWA_006400 [Theileria equi strain WA]|eukprot:XP_004830897.1 hypothetical protein BEWA_006400 [Theileria equi strain WA]
MVQFGIIIKSSKGEIISIDTCEPGKPTCTTTIEDDVASYVWILCYGNRIYPGHVNIGASLSYNNELKCKNGEGIISGFMSHMLVNGGKEEIVAKSCEKYSNSCNLKCEKDCKKGINLILCQSIELK